MPIGHSNRYRSTLNCDIPIVRTTYCGNLSEPIGRSDRYRQTDSHTYLQSNTLSYQFLRTYLSKQHLSIDKFAYLSKVSVGIDMQYPNLLIYKLGYSITCCAGCAIQVNPRSSIPAGCSTAVIRTVVVTKHNLSGYLLLFVLCSY